MPFYFSLIVFPVVLWFKKAIDQRVHFIGNSKFTDWLGGVPSMVEMNSSPFLSLFVERTSKNPASLFVVQNFCWSRSWSQLEPVTENKGIQLILPFSGMMVFFGGGWGGGGVLPENVCGGRLKTLTLLLTKTGGFLLPCMRAHPSQERVWLLVTFEKASKFQMLL